jgi:hypothetical protein
MEIKIGVVYTSRELVLETDDDAAAVTAAVEKALADTAGVLWLTDTKGRRIGVPAEKIAYVEVGSDAGERHVGFGVR